MYVQYIHGGPKVDQQQCSDFISMTGCLTAGHLFCTCFFQQFFFDLLALKDSLIKLPVRTIKLFKKLAYSRYAS